MKDININIPFLNKASLRDKVFLARELSTMLAAGLPIDQAFKILVEQSEKPFLKKAYTQIVNSLEQGQSLSFSISKFPGIFDPVFVAIVRSGENSGQLDKVLLQLADRLEQSQDLNTKVRTAMMYPIFVILTMIVIIFLMMIYVVPQIQPIFEDLKVPMPWTTNVIVAISRFTVKFWWIEIIGFVIIFIALFLFFRSKEGGSLWDKIKIKLPIAKQLYVEVYMARFCRTMAMLFKAGVPVMEMIAISADVIQNKVYTESLRKVSRQVERGIPMSGPMREDKNFPIIVPEMIMVGEQTGKLEVIFNKMAEFYEKETDAMIKGLSGLIEPVLIIIIGSGVAFLVYSIIYPIYSIAQTGF